MLLCATVILIILKEFNSCAMITKHIRKAAKQLIEEIRAQQDRHQGRRWFAIPASHSDSSTACVGWGSRKTKVVAVQVADRVRALVGFSVIALT